MRAVLAICAALATPVWAEGARVRLDCLQDHQCPEGQACIQGGEALELVLAPVEIAADGAGRYQLTTGGETVPARSAGAFGPFVWGLNGVQHTLIYDGPGETAPAARMILHRLPPEGRGRLTHLTCRTDP